MNKRTQTFYTGAVLLGAAAPGAGGAGVASEGGAADKSVYHLLNPTPRGLMREMSTDRPDTTESPYTVDAGHVQVEMSFVDYAYDRQNQESVTARAISVAPLLLKVGVLNCVDVQFGFDPYTWTETKERSTEGSTDLEGFGDTTIRVKVNLWGNDGAEENFGATAFAVMPFITLPTATGGVGTGEFEGGVILPLSVALPAEFALGAMLEFDWVRSGADDRYVVDMLTTVTVGHKLVGDLAGYVEFAGFMNLNGDEDYRAYFDAGLTYAIGDDVQLDAGVRVGLTEAAEDLGVFAGISMRF